MGRTSLSKDKCGICFFSDHRKPIPLLVVALHSLTKHYDGNIHVVLGDSTPDFFKQVMKDQYLFSCEVTSLKYPRTKKISTSQRCFNIKPQIHKLCPFTVNMMYDCDHLFVQDFDYKAFKIIKKYEMISFHYQTKDLSGKSNKRAKYRTQLLNQFGMPCDFLRQTNGGCVGSVKGTKLLDEWADTLDKIIVLNHHMFRKLPDEYSLSYVMGQHNIPIGNIKWSYSLKTGKPQEVNRVKDEVVAIHFPRGRYANSKSYHKELKEAFKKDFLGLKTDKKYYKTCNGIMQIV